MYLILVILICLFLFFSTKNSFSQKQEILNIITPSIRPQNLLLLKGQVDKYRRLYPYIQVRWIIVYDGNINYSLFPHTDYIEEYNIYDPESVKGNAGRNKAFRLIKDGWIYLLDDDTLLVSTPFELISKSPNRKTIHTFTCNTKGYNIGDFVQLKNGRIDSGCFIIHKDLIKDEPYALPNEIGLLARDGRFIERMAKKGIQKHHLGYEPFEWNSITKSL